MVSKQDQFLYDFFRELLYLSDKRIIEEKFDKIEDPEVLKQREVLLKHASANAKKRARQIVKEFKKQNKELQNNDYSSMEEFAKRIQDDILKN